jgi:hypothetical protein
MVVGSLITFGILGVALITDLLGSDKYKTAAAVLIMTLMLVSLVIYYAARRAIRVTLTAEYLESRVPGYLVRTVTIPLRSIQSVHVEKAFLRIGRFGGGYYRDFLVFTSDEGKTISMRIIAYHSRDLWGLLRTLKQLKPHVKFDANIRRFLDG